MRRELVGGPWDGEVIDADDIPVFYIVMAQNPKTAVGGRPIDIAVPTKHRYDLYSDGKYMYAGLEA